MLMDKSINEPLLDANEESELNLNRSSQVYEEEDEEPIEDKVVQEHGLSPRHKSIQHGIEIGKTD